MNSSDGSWRLIYVTPTGQLVGSVHFHNLQEMAVAAAFAGALPGNVAGLAGQLFGQVNPTPNTDAQLGAALQPGAQPSQQNGLQPGGFGTGQNSQNSIVSAMQPAPLQAADSPVFGGSVIGVASKVKQPSIMVYQGGKTYAEWEFIWNPLMNANGVPGQQIAIPGLNAPGQPGALPNPAALPGGANGINIPGTVPPQNGNPAPQPMPGLPPQN
jgi:hypothetical protein